MRLFQKKYIFLLLISLAAVLLTLASMELFFRKKIREVIDREPYTLTENPQGFRVTDAGKIYPDKTSKYRIICLGDSFTEGHGVADNETYPWFLEKFLESKGKNIEVINVANPGISIPGETEDYIKKVSGLDHDLVILLFTGYFDIDMGIAAQLYYKKRGWGDDIYNVKLPSDNILKDSELYRLAKKRMLDERWHEYNSFINSPEAGPVFKKATGIYHQYLLHLKNTVEKHGARFCIVDFISRPRDRIKEFSLNNSITLIDIKDEYSRLDRDKIVMEVHHNRQGNRLLAQLIGSRLLKIYDIPEK